MTNPMSHSFNSRAGLALFSVIVALATTLARADTPHAFTLDTSAWAIQPKTVNLAGDFNGFNPNVLPMLKKGTLWSATVRLSDGTHPYKFVVDKTRWINDPAADKALDADDGNGGKNSAVAIGADAESAAAQAGNNHAGEDAAKDAPAVAGRHTFSLDVSGWQQKPKKLSVAGDFNGWNKDATPLTANGDVWSADVAVPDGTHHYKFVADGERWLTDPKADPALEADDGNGGKNSGVSVGASASAAPAGGAAKAAPAGFEFALDTSTWQEKPKAVNLAGDFNGWSRDAMPMQRSGDVWSLRVPVTEGNHAYKFVIDGTKWLPDPKADKSLETDDGNGGMNSGVVVGPDARSLPPAKPNAINTDAILFNPQDPADLNVVDESSLRLRVRLQKDDAEHVYAKIGGLADPDAATRVELHKLGTTLGYDSYGGTVTVPPVLAGKGVFYAFEFTDGTADVTWERPKIAADTKQAFASPHPLRVELKPAFTTPTWAEHAVWYQIFPERFKNGDPSNDPSNDEGTHLARWTGRWWDVQPGETAENGHFAYDGHNTIYDRRYGGDIQGVRQALPYLKSLGVNAIYLNPVFEAASLHKYDATDYRHIDNHFGQKGDWPVAGETEDPATWKWTPSDKIFLDFVADAHQQGFKVVIDGVFNHVGRPCPFFQDVLENGKNSKYADWFEITDFGNPANWHKMANPLSVHGHPGGVQWNAWDGKNGSLPNWKKDPTTGMAPGPMALIDNITKRWLAPDGDPSRGVDGFRLDAAEQVPHPFWVQWRKVVKETKPDAYITGEIWNPAQPWINDGRQFDAVMNYQFAMPTVAFFANQKNPMAPSAFAKKLGDVLFMYPEQASRTMMNLFDSHDTDRVASMFVNADRAYDSGNRLQDPDAKNYDARKPSDAEHRRMMQAVALQMTFLGSPMIYYGDEAGMWSPDDPSDRQPMTWPGLKFDDPQVGFDQGVFDEYQRLIAIRNTLPVLQTGDYWPVTTDDKTSAFVFARGHGNDVVYVVFNRSDRPQTVTIATPTARLTDITRLPLNAKGTRPTIVLPPEVQNKMAEDDQPRTVDLPAFGYAILVPER